MTNPNLPDLEHLRSLPYLTRQEAADLMRVHLRTIDIWAQKGHIERVAIKLPGHAQPQVRIVASSLFALIGEWEPGEFGRGGLKENPKGKTPKR
jgi:excisionase family DNA binding protein